MRALRRTRRAFAALASLSLAAILLVVFLWCTPTGSRWLVAYLAGHVEGLRYGAVAGSGAAGLVVRDVVLSRERAVVSAETLRLAPRLLPLLARRVELISLELDRLDVHLLPGARDAPEPTAPVNIGWVIEIERAHVAGANLRSGDNSLQRFATIDASARLSGETLALGDVQVATGGVSAAAKANVRLNPPYDFAGPLHIAGPSDLEADMQVAGDSSGVMLQGVTRSPEGLSFAARFAAGERQTIRVTADGERIPLPLPGEQTRLRDFHLEAEGPLQDYRIDASGVLEGGAVTPVAIRATGRGSTRTLTVQQAEVKGAPGTLRLSGEWQLAETRYRVEGTSEDLRYGGLRLERVVSRIDGRGEAMTVDLAAAAYASVDSAPGDLHVSYEGTAREGRASVALSHPLASARFDSSILFANGRIEGDVTGGALRFAEEEWRQADRTHFALAGRDLTMSDHCWAGTEGRICIADLEWNDGRLSARTTGEALAFPWLRAGRLELGARLDTDSLEYVLDLDGRNLQAPLASGAAGEIDEVHLLVAGTRDRYTLEGKGAATGPGDDHATFAVRGSGDGSRIVIDRADLQRRSDRVNLTGELDWSRHEGSAAVSGQVLGRPVSGNAKFSGADLEALQGSGEFTLRENSLRARASEGLLSLQIDFRELGALDQALAGEMKGSLNVRPHDGTLVGELNSSRFVVGDERVEGLALHLKRDHTGAWDASAEVARLGRSGYGFGGGTVTYVGSDSEGVVEIAWGNPEGEVALTSALRWEGETLSGEVRDGRLRYGQENWRLPTPVIFRYSGGVASVADHCWESGDARVCVSGATLGPGGGAVQILGDAIPLSLAQVPYAPEARIDSLVNVRLALAVSGLDLSPRYDGTMRLELPEARVRYFGDQEVTLALRGDATIDGTRIEADLKGMRGAERWLDGKVAIPDIGQSAKLSATARIFHSDLGLVAVFVPQVAEATGSFDGVLSLDTTGSAPRADLHLAVGNDASAVLPMAGITLRDLRFDAGGDAERIELELTGRSGDGNVSATASLNSPFTAARTVEGRLSGKALQLLARRDMEVTGSPDVKFSYDAEGNLGIAGRLQVIDGRYRLRDAEVPVREPSPDVVVRGGDGASPVPGRLDLDLDVSIDRFQVDMYGLNAELAGAVTVTQTPPAPRRAAGSVKLLSGSFTRYGQKFDIERGRLLFAGPLTNPLVDVVSSRKVEEKERTVNVSLLLSGPADNMSSSISATPSMSEAQALSYLILGRPLGTATAGEGASVSAAAVALGLKQAAPITDEIKSVLGLSELTLVPSGLDSATVITGKQLGPDLYVEYSYDVFSRIGGILFNYRISPRLSVETHSGEAKSMQLVYTFE